MVFVFVATLTGFAQQTYEWKAYGLQVTLPSGMKVLQNTDDLFMVGNDQSKLEIHAMEEDLDELTEDDFAELFQTISNNLGVDLSTGDNEELTCKNGAGLFLIAEHKTNKNLFGIIALIGSETSDVFVCVAGLVTAKDAENAGKILGSFNFTR